MAYAIKGTSPFAAFAQDDGFTDSGAAAPLKHAAYDSGSFSGCSGRQPSSMPATPGAAARSSTSVWQRHRSILLAMGLLVAVLGAVLLLEPSAQSAAERLQRHEQQQQQPSLAPRPALPQGAPVLASISCHDAHTDGSSTAAAASTTSICARQARLHAQAAAGQQASSTVWRSAKHSFGGSAGGRHRRLLRLPSPA